jgi:hypothetical protein
MGHRFVTHHPAPDLGGMARRRFNWDRVVRDTIEFTAHCVDRARRKP